MVAARKSTENENIYDFTLTELEIVLVYIIYRKKRDCQIKKRI